MSKAADDYARAHDALDGMLKTFYGIPRGDQPTPVRGTEAAPSSFAIDMALNMLNIQGDDRNTVLNAVAPAQDAVNLINKNQALIQNANAMYISAQPVITQVLKDWQTVGPALSIILAAVRRQQGA